jgi:RNA polymerase sigma-70 factor (ECF subfamily)
MKHDQFKKKILPLTDRLFRLALGITGNRQDAEDVVQDTLFHVWQKRNDWEAIANLEAYCFRATRNNAINKISLKGNQQESIPDYYDIPEYRSNTQERLEEKEQVAMLETYIRQLPEKQQSILHLRTVEELSYKQIAEILNLTEEQVKVNLFRARQKLKAFFEESEQ